MMCAKNIQKSENGKSWPGKFCQGRCHGAITTLFLHSFSTWLMRLFHVSRTQVLEEFQWTRARLILGLLGLIFHQEE